VLVTGNDSLRSVVDLHSVGLTGVLGHAGVNLLDDIRTDGAGEDLREIRGSSSDNFDGHGVFFIQL